MFIAFDARSPWKETPMTQIVPLSAEHLIRPLMTMSPATTRQPRRQAVDREWPAGAAFALALPFAALFWGGVLWAVLS
jgi:hypothetical protein